MLPRASLSEEERYEANAVEALVDDALWKPLLAALRQARASVELTQLLFEPEFAPFERPLTLELEACAQRGARVRILVNENAVIPDSFDDLRERFEGTAVEVERLTMSPNVLHAKLVLVDGEVGFLVDAPFEQKYRDTSAHTFQDPRRDLRKPLHSVSLRLEGPCVARLGDLFENLWRRAVGGMPAALPPRARAEPARGKQALRVLWTSPPTLLSDRQETRIRAAYLDAIERAERLLYIENQYFTSPTIADALLRAIERKPELEVILVLNPHMDVPSYDAYQRQRLVEMGVHEHPRLGAFCLWSPRRVDADPAARAVYVHSKVAIADDAWATIGSANLDSVSIETAQEFVVPVEPNVEVNVELLDGIDGAPATGIVRALRQRLWSEHLGDALVWDAAPPPGGWVGHWRAIAQDNLRRHAEGRWDVSGHVFPIEGMDERTAAAFARER